jgi:hypothetical protein
MPICPQDLCTGTHYLSDIPELGACPACCTPEAMQKLDRTVAALAAPKSFSEQLDELEGMVSDIRTAYREIERERDELQDCVMEAPADLRAYLATTEHGANPVTLPPGPLRDLCETLGIL